MKISDLFINYIIENEKKSLHPKLNLLYNNITNDISKFGNIIFYGPSGSGKYTQALTFVKKYSPSCLKYEKKILITYNKVDYFIKISDIHFEIDMSILGCISKVLWNEIYQHIIDILLSRQNKTGIILCKNFHNIHNELLEIFYSYMQKNFKNIQVKFIIITEHLSFIPENVLNISQIINVSKPNNTTIKNCLKLNKQHLNTNNLKNLLMETYEISNPSCNILSKIYNTIINTKDDINNLEFRDNLYDIFIYNIDIYDLIWNILEKLIKNKNIDKSNLNEILIITYNFLQLYNNNYRAIYHVENYFLKTIDLIIKNPETI